MTDIPEKDFSQSGKPLEADRRKTGPAPATEAAVDDRQDDREYDHRGVALPRRTRLGGIITPQ
ncbi:MAG: hypothetical protein ACYDC6_04970 [Acidobacteriaceae bacterium]